MARRAEDRQEPARDRGREPLWGRHVTTLQLKALLRRAGLPAIRFHDLRHTFATLQLAAGTNPKIVSEVLGHKEVAITLDRYRWRGLTRSWAAAVVPRGVARGAIRAPDEGEIGTAYRMRGIPVSIDPIWVD